MFRISGRLRISEDLVVVPVQQQNRKNFVGIICSDKDDKIATTPSGVASCYLDIGKFDEQNAENFYLLTDEQQEKNNEFCGKSIAIWHVKEMNRN